MRFNGSEDDIAELVRSMENIPESRVALFTSGIFPLQECGGKKVSENHGRALEIAGEITERFPGTEGEALAWLTSFDITGDGTHREMALKAYTTVHEHYPIAFFREIIHSLG